MTDTDLDLCRKAFPALTWTMRDDGKLLYAAMPDGRWAAQIACIGGKFETSVIVAGFAVKHFHADCLLRTLAGLWVTLARALADAETALRGADASLTARALAEGGANG